MAKLAQAVNPNLELFPILSRFPPMATDTSLTGIARLAAASSPAGEGHRMELRSLQVRSVLNRTVSRRGLSFAWSINPYRGCEFACRYCYARYTHEFMELPPEDFERKIFIKQNAAWLLEQELKQVRPGEEIALGTATDPYQPAERREKVTESILEVLARQHSLQIGLVTKSTLIERDIPLLQRVAERNTLVLHLTITTPNTALARLLEPRAPRPDLRLRTVARLRQAGLRTGILCSPLLPGITDTGKALDGMANGQKPPTPVSSAPNRSSSSPARRRFISGLSGSTFQRSSRCTGNVSRARHLSRRLIESESRRWSRRSAASMGSAGVAPMLC